MNKNTNTSADRDSAPKRGSSCGRRRRRRSAPRRKPSSSGSKTSCSRCNWPSCAEPELNAPLRRAANEAAALAWVTLYPVAGVPGVVRGKSRDAVRQAERQARIYESSRELLGV